MWHEEVGGHVSKKHERIVYDTREESGDFGADALVPLVIQICTKTYQKKQMILHSHISAEYRTCILQLKSKPGGQYHALLRRTSSRTFRNFRKADSLMTLVDVGVAARPAVQKAPNYRT